MALAIGLANVAFRSVALSEYSSLPAGFTGPGLFRVRYLLTNGHFLIDPIPAYSYWSGAINTRLGSYAAEVYGAGLLTAGNWLSQPATRLNELILTTAMITLAVWLLVRRSVPRIRDVAVVAALSTFGSPLVIYYLSGWNVVYGWVLILGLTGICVSSLSPRSKVLLSFVLTMVAPPVYHSFGFLIVTYALAIWMLGRLVRLPRIVASPILILVGYFAYQIYVSTQFFGELVTTLRDVLTLGFLEREFGVIALSPATFIGIDLRYVHLVIYGLLLVPVAFVLVRYIRAVLARRGGKDVDADAARNPDHTAYWTAVVALAFSVGVFSLASGARFSGEQLISRGASYVIIPSLVAVIAELRVRAPRHQYLYPLAAVVLLLSGFSFWGQSSSVYATSQVTNAEAQGYRWLAERLNAEEVVWTDFRLSGPFIADGHLRVIGIHGEAGQPAIDLLRAIYYESTPESVGPAIDQIQTSDGKSADYVFLSVLMTRDFPSLIGYGTQFPPLPSSFFTIVESSPEWDLIYENEAVRIYGRPSTTSRASH